MADALLIGAVVVALATAPELVQSRNNQRAYFNPPGIPDATAYVGQYFYLKVPSDIFPANVSFFKASSNTYNELPNWLTFDEKTGEFEGVPTESDLSETYISVKATDYLTVSAKKVFMLEVVLYSNDHSLCQKSLCSPTDDKTFLALLIDADYRHLNPRDRIDIIKNVSQLYSLTPGCLKLSALEGIDVKLADMSFSVHHINNIKKDKPALTILQWQVGCNGNVWAHFSSLLDLIRRTNSDGTLTSTLSFPVHSVRLLKGNFDYRHRRQVHSSGEYEIIGDETEEENSSPDARIVFSDTATPTPTFTMEPSSSSAFIIQSSSTHHHRHQHGVENTLSIARISVIPTPTQTMIETPSSYYAFEENSEYSIDASPTLTFVSPTPSMSFTTEETEETDGSYDENVEGATPSLIEISPTPEETVVHEIRNSPPQIKERLGKILITAGKPLRYKIPEEAFVDDEDGNTTSLTLIFSTQQGFPIPDVHWIQFDPLSQELLALPLESHVSKWNFNLTAVDSGGLKAEDIIEVTVQHHKQRRTVTHSFTVELMNRPPGLSVNWQLALIDEITRIAGDSDSSHITVLGYNSLDNPTSFTWTNDSLNGPKCPETELEELVKVFNGERGLSSIRNPSLQVKEFTWKAVGRCEVSVEPTAREPKSLNRAPSIRNQVDHLNATVGQLLVFTVPSDTFYDEEDGSARNMKLTLTTVDHQPIHQNHWLQFDLKNQEFYGIPMPQNVGQLEYHLICEDSGGKTAQDSLVVIVHPAPKAMYNVEFSVKLGVDYNTFTKSPSLQRSFVEKISQVFDDPNTNAIVISGVTPGSTVITWHNKSLPTDTCPNEEIHRLRQVIVGDDERVTQHAETVFGPELPLLGARLTPTGLCQGGLTEVTIDSPDIATSDVTAVSNNHQYIIGLVVPAIVISIILLCAGLVACVLYQRRRRGKLTIGDEDERQCFRSKGIPVIFQDELDERPEPTNKSPVIMKEEKPPLPPPEYQRAAPLATTALLSDTEDSLYQPPPPFTTNRDSARPKPTPTYRMPPPYVPP